MLIDQHSARIVEGQVQTYLTDALGTVRGVLDADGGLNNFNYSAFGKLRSQRDSGGNPYLFIGRALDAKSGGYYFRARQYSPELGRFPAVDRQA